LRSKFLLAQILHLRQLRTTILRFHPRNHRRAHQQHGEHRKNGFHKASSNDSPLTLSFFEFSLGLEDSLNRQVSRMQGECHLGKSALSLGYRDANSGSAISAKTGSIVERLYSALRGHRKAEGAKGVSPTVQVLDSLSNPLTVRMPRTPFP